MSLKSQVDIDYTNWRGERRTRPVLPLRLAFQSSHYHPHTQWVLIALDLEDFKEKEFTLKDIHEWFPPTTIL